MDIYDLNQIKDLNIRSKVINQIPNIVRCGSIAYLINSRKDISDSFLSKYIGRGSIRINQLNLINIRIKNDMIIGDIEYGNLYKPPSGNWGNWVDLKGRNDYYIIFKPSFNVFLTDDSKFKVGEFSSFTTFLLEKSVYREERLAKLLDLN